MILGQLRIGERQMTSAALLFGTEIGGTSEEKKTTLYLMAMKIQLKLDEQNKDKVNFVHDQDYACFWEP